MRLVEDKLLALSKKQMETHGADAIKAIQTPMYQATVKYWNASGVTREKRAPIPKFIVTVRKERGKGATLRIRSYAQNPSTRAPSYIWHLIEGGIGDHVQKKNSPPIFLRKSPRTQVKNLNSGPFPGFTTKKRIYIKAGTHIRGTPARLWYEVIRDLTIDAIQRDPRFRDAEITKVVIRRPKR